MHVVDRVGDRSGHGFFAGESWGEYVLGVLGQGLPWTPLALIGLARAVGSLRRGESTAGDRLMLAWTVVPLVLVSLPGGRNTHYAIYAMAPWSVWSA
jgi:4-amino-4-deoxy-L-arabinose transferase-like glycosyltransferase